MIWREVVAFRSKQKDAIYAEISRLERSLKKVGTTDALEIIREALEDEYKVPVRIRHDTSAGLRRLVMYKSDSSKKQIQYDKNVEAEITVIDDRSGPIMDLRVYQGHFGDRSFKMPDTISEIYKIMMESTNHSE